MSTSSLPSLAHRHRLRWAVLVAAVLLLHLAGLEWLLQRQATLGVLHDMAEPTFDKALLPQSTDAQTADAARAAIDAAPPTATVGQVIQARTLAPVSPVAEPAKPARMANKARPATARPHPADEPRATPATPADTSASSHPGTASDTPAAPVSPIAAAAPVGTDATPPQPPGSTTPAAPSPPLAGTGPTTPPATVPDTTPTGTPDGDTAWLQAWPRSTRLAYQLKGNYRGELHGSARVQWQRSGMRYQTQVAVNVSLLLDMRLTSQGRITPTRLWPEAYEEERRGKKRGVRLGDQTMTLDNGDTAPRPAHLQDTASQFVQIAQDFATRRVPLAVGTVIPVTLARPSGAADWVYDVIGQETLHTPLGDLDTWHLRPRARPATAPGNSVSAEIWFAPSLQYMPVRIRLTLNPETWLDLTLENVAQSD